LVKIQGCHSNEHVYFAKNGRETDRKTDRKKQSTSANYRLTTTHNAQMTIRTEAKPPKKTLKKNNSYVENI